MIFGINTNERIEVKRYGANSEVLIDGYTFATCEQVDEDTLFNTFLKVKFRTESLQRVITRDAIAGRSNSSPYKYPYNGLFIIPKLYGYFPFLDCDDRDVCEEATYHLESNNVPYTCFKSSTSKDSYWIICDKEDTFDNTLEFIKQYPADHRYAWVAEHKQEFCIRAVQKYPDGVPAEVNTYDGVNGFSGNYKFWINSFKEYWSSGLISSYINRAEVINNI